MENIAQPKTLPKNKHELRDYLESMDLYNPDNVLELSVATEIVENVKRVMAPYLAMPEGDDLRRYYGPAIRGIEKKFSERDFSRRGFLFAVGDLISCLTWE